METFHHHCLKTSLGILRALQIFQHISNEVRNRVSLPVPLTDMIFTFEHLTLSHVIDPIFTVTAAAGHHIDTIAKEKSSQQNIKFRLQSSVGICKGWLQKRFSLVLRFDVRLTSISSFLSME